MDTDGKFYLGRIHNSDKGETSDQKLYYDPDDLTTHALVVGMTGSGKTGLCIDMLEEAALHGVRRDKKGRWILEGDGHAEFALTGLVDGNIESVVLDRIRIDEHGIHWIVDYKTSTHEGGNLQGFLNAEVERYKPQLDKYAAIYGAFAKTRPRCALYFPLLQEFVEV